MATFLENKKKESVLDSLRKCVLEKSVKEHPLQTSNQASRAEKITIFFLHRRSRKTFQCYSHIFIYSHYRLINSVAQKKKRAEKKTLNTKMLIYTKARKRKRCEFIFIYENSTSRNTSFKSAFSS